MLTHNAILSVRVLLALFIGLSLNQPAPFANDEAVPADAATDQPQKTRVRVVSLQGIYVDHPLAPELDPFILLGGVPEKTSSFVELCESIDAIAKDTTIDYVYFDLSAIHLQLNLAQLSELGRHIDLLHQADKETFAWIEAGDTVHYAIASACKSILMADMGVLDLPSLSLAALHFRDAMDLVGIRASVARVGDFKGAVEPFTRSEMSAELRKHYQQMLKSMNDALVNRMARHRKVTPEQLRKLQQQRIFSASQALRAGLVDYLVPFGSGQEKVASLLESKVDWIKPSKKKQKPPSFFELMAQLLGGAPEKKADRPALAILHLNGQIMDGEVELPGLVASGPTVKVIQELESDSNVRAVVVRINSPGGSATASESIRKALERLAEKKPVVVSMGELAASGGYWISCLNAPIYAEPGTITGSIGVFALKLGFGPLFSRIGLNLEHVTLDNSAAMFDIDHDWSKEEEEQIQSLINEIYESFIQHVANSRKLSAEKVASLAGGRIWSGAQAKDLHLIDEIGGIDSAIARAAKEAQLEPGFDLLHRPRPKSFFEALELFGQTQASAGVLDAKALDWARKAGFSMAGPLALIQAAMSGKAPQAWLLTPTELQIR